MKKVISGPSAMMEAAKAMGVIHKQPKSGADTSSIRGKAIARLNEAMGRKNYCNK